MATVHSTALISNESAAQISNQSRNEGFNVALGRALFTDPQKDRHSAVVESNVTDLEAGIRVRDLIRIDFTASQLGDGLYIITLDDNWIGYRRFQRMPSLTMVHSGKTIPVTPDIFGSIKVVGKVLDIYRSTGE